jgi:porin
MSTIRVSVILSLLLVTLQVTPIWSQEDVPAFGGPSSTGAQLNEDAREAKPLLRLEFMDKALAPWFGFKTNVDQKIGLSFGLDYTSVLMGSTSALPGKDQGSASGIFRFYSNWTFFGRESGNTGSLVFKVESRHKYGFDTAPQLFGFDLGYNAIVAGQWNRRNRNSRMTCSRAITGW